MADDKKNKEALEALHNLQNAHAATSSVSNVDWKSAAKDASSFTATANAAADSVRKSFTKNVDGEYISSFLKDSRLHMNSALTDNVRMGVTTSKSIYESRKKTYGDLSKRSYEISRYLEDNKDKIDEETYKSLKDYLDAFDKTSSQSIHSFYRNQKFYSQFKTQEEYDKYVTEKEAYEAKVNLDLDTAAKEIKDLEAKREEWYWNTDYDATNHRERVAFEKQLEELDNEITQKKLYMNQARQLQEGVKLSSVSDPFSGNYDHDFRDLSKYSSTIQDSHAWWSNGTGDAQYEWINNQNGYRDSYEKDMDALNSVAAATTQSSFYVAPTESAYRKKGYDHLTEDEIAIYNYYYAKDGKDKAQEYLDSIQETLNYRKATEMYGELEDNTAQELIFGVNAGLDQFASGISNFFNTEDNYIPQSAVQMASGMVREDLADAGAKLPDWMGGASLGQVGYDAITTSANMAPSILTSMAVGILNPVAGQVAGHALMGMSAAGGAYQEALNEGYDKNQARGYGLLVGASEIVMEKVLGGISALGGNAMGKTLTKNLSNADTALKMIAKKLGGSMLSEFGEEYLQEVLTPVFKNMTLGTHEDVKLFSAEALYAGILGALTAGVMEGPTAIDGEVKVYNTGKQLQNADISAQRIADIGKTFSADTVAYQLAGKVNENTTAYAMGRLFNEIGATLSEQNVNDITNALVSKGMNERVARRNAEALAYVVEGGQLTDAQVAIIEANEVLAEAARTTLIDANTTWNQRSQSYNEVLKSLAQEKASRMNPAEAEQENAPASDKVDAQNKEGSETDSEAETATPKVKSIATIKDGQVTVKMEDGTEVNVKESGIDPDDGVRIETIASIDGISTEDANFILNTLRVSPGRSAQVDSLGAKEAYKYGFYGFSQDHIAKHGVFANALTDTQRQAIYDTGRAARQKQVDNKNATVAKKKATTEKNSATGKVHFDGDRSALTERQNASLTAMERVAEVLGIQIHVFESKVNERGKRIGANGWYDPKDSSIHIDLHAGATGEGTMLFTLAHELTHHIRKWSPAKFKVLADFLMQEYGKKGVNVDALVREQMAKAKRNGRTISYDTAYEEVVADSMEMMLSDGNVMKRLEKLKAQDKDLWHKIKRFIDEMAAKIRAVYKGMSPDSVEGRYVAEMGEAIYRLQELFAEGLVDASENYQASEQVLAQAGIAVNSDTDSGSLLSVRDVLSDADRKKVATALADRFGVTEKEAMQWLKAETSMASLILNPKYSAFLDYEADPNEVAIKQNSDYPQGTVDFSNICKKRREFTQVMNRVLRNFPNHVFAATDLAKIRTIMGQEGMTLPCGICYVEDRRQLDTIVAQDFINGLKLYREGSKTRPDGKPFNANQLKGLQLTDGDTYVPTIYELVTLEGRNSLKDKNPNMEAAWVRYNNARGMQSVRLLTNEAEYKRQILKYSPKTVQTKNDYGGLRIYSFSDMEMFHLIDIIQVLTDSAAVGLKVQGYTKVNEYAKAVKDTGEKLNRSLIPKGDLGYRIENGKVVLEYDPVEGIDIYSEDFFDSKDNPNVGNIVIGINATQIRAAMRSDFIDYIIPFHTGQSAEVLGEKGIAAWNNYKDSQSEIDIATGKKSKHQINIYTEVFQAAEAEGKPIQNKRDFVNKFLAVCKENGLQPRFSEFLNTDENGDYVYTEGYHKFLVDFKTFAQTEVGEYLPQMPVKPIFDDAYITGLLEAYVEEQKAKDAEVAAQMPKVIERITNEIIKPAEAERYVEAVEASDMLTKFSLREEDPPKRTITAYKVFRVADGKLYPPKIANLSDDENLNKPLARDPRKGKSRVTATGNDTPVGVWINADVGGIAVDENGDAILNTNGRIKVYDLNGMKGNGDFDQKTTLAFRPGWHLGSIPEAIQFLLGDGTMPDDLVYAECEIAADIDYQAAAMSYGVRPSGKFVHADAGLPAVPVDGYYKYKTNPKTDTHPWFISGAIKVNRIIGDAERREICAREGITIAPRYSGKDIEPTDIWESGQPATPKNLTPYKKSQKNYENDQLLAKTLEKIKGLSATNPKLGYIQRDLDFNSRGIIDEIEKAKLDVDALRSAYEKHGYNPYYFDTDEEIKYSGREYGGIREVLAKNGLDELSKRYGSYFPLSADFDATMSADNTPLVMETVLANHVKRKRKESAFKTGKQAFARSYGGKTTIHIKQMGIDAELFPSVAGESIAKALGRPDEQSTLDVIPHIGNILSNSIFMGIERIAHTHNKGTAIYGYRLYNLYWYQNGNKKTPNCLVCTVVQDLDKAEGYVFQNIENVTVRHGLPGKNSGMPTPSNGNTYTVSQLYQTVKGIDRLSGGLKYTDVERETYLFAYTERNDGVKYQDRSDDSVSNRSLLANALESVAQNDIERKRLQEYKEKISLINAEEENLRALNKQLRFEKDPENIRTLRFEANQAANRINTYDRQLLRLEASKPLKDVLTREKKMAYDRGVQKGKKALEAYRERAEKKQQETIERYQESRKRGVENRQKTAVRQKIRKTIRDLDKILNRGDKKRNVKEGMKDFVADALFSAEILFTDNYSNEDMVRNGVGTDLTPEEAKFMNEARAIMDELANLPTGYDGWMARQDQEFTLKGRLNYRMGKLKDVFVRERARLNKTQVSEVLGNLADSYGRLQNSEYAHVQGAYHEAVHEYLKMLQEDVGGTIIKDMTLGQLEELYKAYTMVMTTVHNANRMFAENLNNTRDALANRVMFEVHEAGGEHGLWSKAADKLNSFSWNNEKPVYAFERIGSKTLKTLYGNIRKGQDGWAMDIQEANDFRMNMYKKYKHSNWDMLKQYKFTSSSGIDFELNLDQIMSLYAYSKRAQAHDHLLKGGFVFDGNTEVVVNKKGIKMTFLNKTATAYNLSFEILENIISKLTPEQKAFVDDMQEYLSTTMGEKGNEVSMELYGVKLFNEKFYFPLRSAGQYMEKAKEADMKQKQGQVNIANSGFSKAVKIKASNPVVLTGFMEVWAGHVNEMSMYHSFVLPMEDFRRVYNYSSPHMEGQQSASVNGVIQNAYGAAATDYIDQLYRDLNGGALTDNRTGPINKLMGLFKKGAVFASASVTIQQPSAIARATALVDIKHFVGPKVDAKRHKALWEEVKQYAPVAVIKEMGFFDTNMGRSATDFLTAEEYSGIKEKAKALVKDESYRDEQLSKAPALADELAWCAIWEAVKRETKAKHPKMDAKSEEFLRIAGDRFSEVIDKTQVYDSVLARSANMRSKDTGMKMATAFMAEPTTSINMVADALRKGKKGNKKQAARIIGSVVSSVILNSFLVAWVYAARDDDEDETFREKYLSSFISGIVDGVNPMTYIPFLKDIVSIVQGYDIERSDMAVISDLWNAWKQLKNDDVSAWRKVEGFVGSICQIFGLPVKNIMRDVRSVFQAYDTIVHGEKNTTRGTAIAIVEGITGQKPSNPEQLYKARKSGDKAHAARVEARYDDEDSANAAVRKAITDRYMDDELTLAQATMQLTQYAGMKADEAYWLMDGWKYKKETGSDDGYSKYNDFYEAVQTGKDLKAVIKEYTDNGVKQSTLSGQITSHFKDEYVQMSAAERANIKGYLLNAYEQCGVSRKTAEEKLRDWDFEAKHGGSYEEIVAEYKNGNINETTMRSILADKGYSKSDIEDKISDWNVYKIYGYDYSELDDAYRAGELSREEFRQAMIDNGTFPAKADQAIVTYDWMRDNAHYGLEYSDAGKYAHPIENYGKSLADVGLDPDIYLEYKELKKGCKGVDADNDGTADSGTLRAAKFEMIDSLPITNDQKDALAAIDYGMKSIKRYAPWH